MTDWFVNYQGGRSLSFIDLRSDTVTHPTKPMIEAINNAELGDDGWADDPTVNKLQDMAAHITGKEAALFVPSGTMGNLVSVITHAQRGEEIIVGDQSHLYLYEYAGASAFGGISLRQVANQKDGTLDIAQVEAAIRPTSERFPTTSLVSIENTHNRCNGAVLTTEYTQKISDMSHRNGANVHLDGARIFNASVALGVDVKDLVAPVDSLTFCFSKGLSCPAGSIICGDSEFIRRARHIRNALGGGMRQVGILAAAAIVALNDMVDRLAEDHSNACRLAYGLANVSGISIDPEDISTNIVYFGIEHGSVPEFLQKLKDRGVLAQHPYGSNVRMVTHYGISQEDIDYTLDMVKACI